MATDSPDGKKSIRDMDTNELFSYFVEKAVDVQPITDTFGELVSRLGLEGKRGRELYDGLKDKLTNWKAKSLWEILDKKVRHACHICRTAGKSHCA